MNTSRLSLFALAAVAATLGTACAEDVKVPAAKEGGQAAQPAEDAPLAYPAGPYGITKGSVIANLKFYGLHNPQDYPQVLTQIPDMEPVELAEFYNPTGTDTFTGDYRTGEAKPTVLWLDISAQWCPPCQDESKTKLPVDYANYHDKGLELMLELIEDTTGAPAIPKNLWQWSTKYKTGWPAVIDPSRQVDQFFVQSAYPTNILIDTSTMKIAYVVAGEPQDGDIFYTNMKKFLKP